MFPQYFDDDEHEKTLKKIDEIIFNKPIWLLAGKKNGESTLSRLPKELIMFISKLFIDIIRKENISN